MNLKLFAAFAAVALTSLLLAAVSVGSGVILPAESETDPSDDWKFVTGKVFDMHGLPITGAAVNVSMYDGATLRSYYEDTTDSLGVYLATFGGYAGEPWAVGDTILVFAEFDGDSNTNSTIATEVDGETNLTQYVNVTLEFYEIPEFGSLGTALPVIGVLGLFVALFYARREDKS